MAILITNPQPSELATSTPLFREFVADQTHIELRASMGAAPARTKITLTLPDPSLSEKYVGYENFKLNYFIDGDDFFDVENLVQDEPMTTTTKDVYLNYYNFAQLDQGVYAGKFLVYISATNTATSTVDVLDTIEINPEMELDGMDLEIDPDILVVHHVKDSTPSWTETINVTAGSSWSLLNGDEENHSSLSVNDNPEQHLYFDGNENLTLKLTTAVNELDFGLHELNIYFYQPSLVAQLTIHLVITDSEGLSIQPNALYFEAIKGISEAPEQIVTIYSPHPVDAAWSQPWTEHYLATIPGVPNFYQFVIRPMHSSNLTPGVYAGLVYFDINGTINEITIQHTVYGTWDSSYQKDVHFTKDNDILKVFTQSAEESYVRLSAVIKVYDFKGGMKTVNREWSLAFLNNRAELNLGREVDDYLKLLNSPSDQIKSSVKLTPDYKAMSVKITARELTYEDEEIVAMYALPYQYFLRGRKPLTNRPAFWLTHTPNLPVRVTKNSRIQLNVFKPVGEPLPIVVKRNGELFTTIGWDVAKMINQACFLSREFNFSTIANLEPGEKIGFVYDGVQRNFIVLPTGTHSLNIAWINQFEVLESFEFTGEHDLPVDYKHDVNDIFKNWQETLKKSGTTKSQTLSADTGWIFKDNIHIIDDLIASTRAWLLPPKLRMDQNEFEDSYLELIPIAKKMSGYDSRENLYKFNVEFQLNRKYEDAIHVR